MNLQDALDRFVVQLEADGRSAHTIAQYRRHLRGFSDWLAHNGHTREVLAIGHEQVAGFLAAPETRTRAVGGPKRATSMNALRTSLRVMFRYLHEAGVITQNPARLVRRALCGTPPPKTLADDDRARLMAALAADTTAEGRRDHALFTLLLTTGIRVGSAVALDVADVDLGRGEITLRTTKGDRPETVFTPATTCALMRGYLGERTAGPLFPGRGSDRITTRHVGRRFREWLKKAGVTRAASPHVLRHTFATAIYKRSGDIALTQAALRHRSISSTLIYARADAGRVREVVEA